MTDEERQEEGVPEEEPQIYTVKKDMDGWQFNRRAFLTAAGATAAAAALGTAAACGESAEEVGSNTQVVITQVVTATPSSTPEPTEATEPSLTDTPTPTASASPTSTKTATPTHTPTDAATPTPTAKPTLAVPKAAFVKDVTIPDGTVMKPGQAFTKTWRFKNVGAVPWGKGVKLVFLEGKYEGFESKKMGGPDSVDVPNVQPGKTVDVGVDLVAPNKLGHHRSYWRLQLGNGEWLEKKHYADIFVASPQPLEEYVEPRQEGVEFKVKIEGKWVEWTQPCGMPIPPGAVCICNCVAVPPPGEVGTVPPGEEGGTVEGPDGETRWLPCNSPIPPGWTCSCNCVSVPAQPTCGCNADVCTCDSVHYWHPC